METPKQENDPQYNHAYIRSKEKQAEEHFKIDVSPSDNERIPPGQYETKVFPILDLGIRPSRERYLRWTLEIKGGVTEPKTLTLEEVRKMADENITADFHCVTRWSRLDLNWKGIPFQRIVDLARPADSAKFVIFHSFDKYTTNVPLEELRRHNVIVAIELEGGEIPPEHGGPIRMIIPHLYGWKSAKFLTGIEFLDKDEPGFWEVRGYSNHARPWIEERYS